MPTFPLSGFTLRWYHQFLTNPDLQDALKTSAIVAALSSLGAVILGLLAAIALVRHPFRGTGPVSALLLSPLVIPFIVFGSPSCCSFTPSGSTWASRPWSSGTS